MVDIQSHFKLLICCYFSQKINVLDFQQISIPIHMGVPLGPDSKKIVYNQHFWKNNNLHLIYRWWMCKAEESLTLGSTSWMSKAD